MTLVRVGRVGRAHGVRGEVTIEDCHLTPVELHAAKRFTWRSRSGVESRVLVLATARPAHDRVLARFEGVADRDAAAALGLGTLWADEAALPDPGPGTVYAYQLEGFTVTDASGRAIGTLEHVLTTAAHPVYVVRAPAPGVPPAGGAPADAAPAGREILVPAHPDFIVRVDMEARVIVMNPPPGFDAIG